MIARLFTIAAAMLFGLALLPVPHAGAQAESVNGTTTGKTAIDEAALERADLPPAEERDLVWVDDKGHLGKTIDMTVPFVDENGEPTSLAKIANGKPIVLSLVYYRCTSICSPFLNGISDVVNKSPKKFLPGENYTIVSVSFNPREDHVIAKGKQDSYLSELKQNVGREQWRFLTGKQESITALTSSVGFYYTPEGEDYKHPSSLIVLSPDGKISRYINGLQFFPMDIMLAVLDASEGKWGPTVARVMEFCFTKEPQGRGYYFDFLKVVGSLILLSLLIFFLVLTLLVKRGTIHEQGGAPTPQGSPST